MSSIPSTSAGVDLGNTSDFRIDVEMGFISRISQDESKFEPIPSIIEVPIEAQTFEKRDVSLPKNLENVGSLRGREVMKVSHWSTKVAFVATAFTGFFAASGVIVWSTPSLNPVIPYAFYAAVPTGIISTIAHGVSSFYLKQFVPQKALEESVEVAEGVTLTAKDIVKKLKKLELELHDRTQDIAKLTLERENLSKSLSENIDQFTAQIDDFRHQNEFLQARVAQLDSQLDELNAAKNDIADRLEGFKRENGSLKETISRATQLGAQAKAIVHQMGAEVDSLDSADDDIALQVEALSKGIKELKTTTEKQRAMLQEISEAREAAQNQNSTILAKLELLEKAKADLQMQLELLQKENEVLALSIGRFIELSSDVAENARFFDERDDRFLSIAEKLSSSEVGLRELVRLQDGVIKNREGAILRLQEQIATLQTLSQEVHKGSLETQDILVAMDAQEKKFTAEIQVLTDQIRSYEELKIRKESEIARLEAQVSRLESNVSDYKIINSQMETNLSKLMKKLAEANEGSL
jgi:chromosome segregation ATPase